MSMINTPCGMRAHEMHIHGNETGLLAGVGFMGVCLRLLEFSIGIWEILGIPHRMNLARKSTAKPCSKAGVDAKGGILRHKGK
jgi:hypothetical protein